MTGLIVERRHPLIQSRYIARPLLIKGRKFDIRVHWLVAWTKPLLVFYNHNASVIRLSLNLYREFDFDRATHLTNLVRTKLSNQSGLSLSLSLSRLVSSRVALSLRLLSRSDGHDDATVKVISFL